MVVTIPIFGPMQLILRRLILTPEKLKETLRIHNLEVMDLARLERVVRRFPGASKVYCSYLGNMSTWFRFTDPYVRKAAWPVLAAWKAAALLPAALNLSCRLFSPQGAIVFRKLGE